MTDDPVRWIWVPNWEDFQHYRDRRPTWIKAYVELLDKPEYLDLTLSERGILHGVWLVTARMGNGRLTYNLATVRRALGLPKYFRLAALDPLIHAGFIDIRASKGLATRYQPASAEGLLRKPKEGGADSASAVAASKNGEKPLTPTEQAELEADLKAWRETGPPRD